MHIPGRYLLPIGFALVALQVVPRTQVESRVSRFRWLRVCKSCTFLPSSQLATRSAEVNGAHQARRVGMPPGPCAHNSPPWNQWMPPAELLRRVGRSGDFLPAVVEHRWRSEYVPTQTQKLADTVIYVCIMRDRIRTLPLCPLDTGLDTLQVLEQSCAAARSSAAAMESTPWNLPSKPFRNSFRAKVVRSYDLFSEMFSSRNSMSYDDCTCRCGSALRVMHKHPV